VPRDGVGSCGAKFPVDVGTLTMFDRMIFRGHLTRLFARGAISAMLWQLGCPAGPTVRLLAVI
jgi:hypothetical protein